MLSLLNFGLLGEKKSVMNLLKMSNGIKCFFLLEIVISLHPGKEMGFSEIDLINLHYFLHFSFAHCRC